MSSCNPEPSGGGGRDQQQQMGMAILAGLDSTLQQAITQSGFGNHGGAVSKFRSVANDLQQLAQWCRDNPDQARAQWTTRARELLRNINLKAGTLSGAGASSPSSSDYAMQHGRVMSYTTQIQQIVGS